MEIQIGELYKSEVGAVRVIGKLPNSKKRYCYVAVVTPRNNFESFVEYYDTKGKSQTGKLDIVEILELVS